MTYEEADRRFGTDKPDTRFGLEIEDATELTRGSAFGVFAGAEAVRFLRVPRAYSRAELDRAGGGREGARGEGARVPRPRRGRGAALADREVPLRGRARRRSGSSRARRCSSAPTRWEMRRRVLGDLRLHLGRELGLIDEERFTFLWITDFPMFEWDEDEAALGAATIPSRARRPSGRPLRRGARRARSPYAYDLVVNGNELGGGSLRIHEPELQARVFDLLAAEPGGAAREVRLPPRRPRDGRAAARGHRVRDRPDADGGRREPNLRDVIAFPKNQAGLDPMSGAPSEVTPEQLDELGIRLRVEPPQRSLGERSRKLGVR